MSFASSNSAQTYAKVGVETAVAAADSHQLIVMLFDGALLAIAKAEGFMSQGMIAEKGEAISRAIDIIANGLRASLDFSAGDELAGRLAGLYDYMGLRLVHANLKNDLGALQEVSRLLGEIKSAWEEIADDPAVLSASKAAA
ncbi:MAG: flagellar export chaperone FliS [Sulfuritalea sp.]|nr:flagellar export chaperone FliS [Sulfuritalea sp.]